jgi:sRNA-binding carbon storage regulator CsrA
MVKSVQGLQAKIGIDAPREVVVMREELLEREPGVIQALTDIESSEFM